MSVGDKLTPLKRKQLTEPDNSQQRESKRHQRSRLADDFQQVSKRGRVIFALVLFSRRGPFFRFGTRPRLALGWQSLSRPEVKPTCVAGPGVIMHCSAQPCWLAWVGSASLELSAALST